jgi:xylulose-5-phosphate/fructose-6-phosphate phosphoketolase
MDNPNLIVSCIVGDGEAETGPTATAWHSIKYLDPVESGAVLPIVHINGYKISSPSIFGTMRDEELQSLFLGYGYQPRIVAEPDLDASLYAAMDWAYHQIRSIQKAARSGHPIEQAQWPVILFRSPKGMGGIKEINGELIEGTCRSHQVPARATCSPSNSSRIGFVLIVRKNYSILKVLQWINCLSYVQKEISGWDAIHMHLAVE